MDIEVLGSMGSGYMGLVVKGSLGKFRTSYWLNMRLALGTFGLVHWTVKALSIPGNLNSKELDPSG